MGKGLQCETWPTRAYPNVCVEEWECVGLIFGCGYDAGAGTMIAGAEVATTTTTAADEIEIEIVTMIGVAATSPASYAH